MKLTKAQDRLTSIGIWAWLAIVEKEKDRLTPSGRVALELLRADLERLASPAGTTSEKGDTDGNS
jgi:hypothetical protein